MTLKAEKAFQEVRVNHRTIMKPRKISSDCGLAIRIADEDVERCSQVILLEGLAPAGFFRKAGEDWECVLQMGEQSN
jgi:hypothetical protein